MDFGLGEDISQHNRIFRWYKSLNVLFHYLSIATMLAPNQPLQSQQVYQSYRACRLREFQTKEQQISLIVIAFPFLCHSSFDSLMQYTPWTSKEKWETTASPWANNAHGSVRTLIIYPGSQVCMYCQYKLMSCWNCWTKCYRMNHCTQEAHRQKEKRVQENVNNLK